ncbi:hypothetical protein QOZ98_001361 [Planomicrobium stackebrandtii]|uniref:Uncharacterized protein n=1 Tax=Planomicrobium stackebrandtii TaxID=253160 RepID=A0ABU0GT52_9BACL|nr:hypothetical protein [Planomicrobium stackebrandtii]MDQ0428535.1 hypothetical protein [Planomicrobium stackebrandtii]
MTITIKYWIKRVVYLFKSYNSQVRELNEDYRNYADCNKKFFYDDYMDRRKSDKKLIMILIAFGVSLFILVINKIRAKFKAKRKMKISKRL